MKFLKRKSETLQNVWRETKWIYQHTARYALWNLLFILMGLGGTLLSVGSTLTFRALVDAAAAHRSGWLIMGLGATYVLLLLADATLIAIGNRISTYVSIRAGNEIRADVFSRFLDVRWESASNYHSGDLLSRVNGDVSAVAAGVLGWIPSLIVGLARLMAALLLILYLDPVMGVFSLMAAPAIAMLSRVLVKNMRTYSQKTRQSQAELTAFYEESLQNLSAVKAFDLKAYHKNKLDILQKKYQSMAMDYNRFSVWSHTLLSAAGMIVSCLCLGWGVFRMWNSGITYGTMVLFVQLATMVSSSIGALVALIPSAISATVAAGRIMAILELPMENTYCSPNAQDVLDRAQEGVHIQIEDLCFGYEGGERVFDGLSLEASPGEIIGVISPSGGGKTTLLRLLLGLVEPQSGAISVCAGKATAKLEPSMRSLMTYVSQEKVVFSGTIAESLRLMNPNATEEQMREALELACAWDFVERLPKGIYTELGERGAGLSEGQKQRICIARALLSEAPVLLMDEATSALDFETEWQVLKNILVASHKRTVIVTTHRPAVLKSCTRVYTIQRGNARAMTNEEVKNFAQRAVEE